MKQKLPPQNAMRLGGEYVHIKALEFLKDSNNNELLELQAIIIGCLESRVPPIVSGIENTKQFIKMIEEIADL